MLARFFIAISSRAAAPVRRPDGPRQAAVAVDPADDTARHLRALAESCADGLAALAYAQFADLLDPGRASVEPDRNAASPRPAALVPGPAAVRLDLPR